MAFANCTTMQTTILFSSNKDLTTVVKRQLTTAPETTIEWFTSEYGALMEVKSSKSTLYLERLRQLCVETYKATNGLAPVYVSDIFQRKIHVHSYSLRDTNTLSLPKFNTIKYGKLSLRYEATNIWNKLPPSVKCVPSLDVFKKSIKTWKGLLCMCGSCMLRAFKL